MRCAPTVSMLLVGIGLLVGCSAEKTPGQATAKDAAAVSTAEQPPTSSASSASSAPPAAGGDMTEPCTLLTGERVGEELDRSEVTAVPLPGETAEGGTRIYLCEYTSGGVSVGALTVSVYQDNGLDARTLIDVVAEDYTAPRDVPGVGEAAATFDDDDGRYLASAKTVSGTQVMVMWVGGKDLGTDQLTAIVRPVMDQL